jgi:DNA-binding protein HU-beta
MGTVTKDALVRRVAETTGQKIAAARATIDAFLDAAKALAEAGDTVRLMGFGSFQVKARPPRIGRNPKTGEAMEIAESRRLTFKASKT